MLPSYFGGELGNSLCGRKKGVVQTLSTKDFHTISVFVFMTKLNASGFYFFYRKRKKHVKTQKRFS